MRQLTAAVLIPTYKPDKKFARLLQMLERQTYPVTQLIIMNTEKAYWNEHGYQGITGLEVHHVTKEQFDHGGTRRQGMQYVKTDICICMTQDAVPADEHLVAELVRASQQALPPVNGEPGDMVAAAYARQLPDKTCRMIERFTRLYNYPEQSFVKTEADRTRLGVKTYFCSNVCAAYSMEVYHRMDGFVKKTIFNEDMLYAADVIAAGYGIAYVAEARVIHSHNYSSVQQLKRNFDLAVSQAEHPEVFSGLSSEGEGFRMVRQTARYLKKHKKWYLFPELVIQSGSKYIGYWLGKRYRMLPDVMIRKLTSNPAYWQ